LAALVDFPLLLFVFVGLLVPPIVDAAVGERHWRNGLLRLLLRLGGG
jgi:ABC-type Fe3+-siderophore transport system permease subunit